MITCHSHQTMRVVETVDTIDTVDTRVIDKGQHRI